MEREEQQLSRLFQAYRDAVPDPECSAGFMPVLWNKIDARRGFSVTLRRWTSVFVSVAAAACVAMVLYMTSPARTNPAAEAATYVETLDRPQPLETLAYSEMVGFEEAVDVR